MEYNKVYNCDVLEGLRQLPDGSIDLIITSPPYNKGGLNGVPKPNSARKRLKSAKEKVISLKNFREHITFH